MIFLTVAVCGLELGSVNNQSLILSFTSSNLKITSQQSSSWVMFHDPRSCFQSSTSLSTTSSIVNSSFLAMTLRQLPCKSYKKMNPLAVRLIFWTVYLILCTTLGIIKNVSGETNKAQVHLNTDDNAVMLAIKREGKVLLSGVLGTAIPNAAGKVSLCPQTDFTTCFRYRDYARLEINETADECAYYYWTSTYAKKLEDCFEIPEGHQWFGGGETYFQKWPIENVTKAEVPFVTGDTLQGAPYAGIAEPYWLISSGVSIKVDDNVPLFMRWSPGQDGGPNRICLIAKPQSPYTFRDELHLSYRICTGNNLKEVHEGQILGGVIPKPKSLPDTRMFVRPFWSTWVQYKTQINQSLVLNFARRIVSEGFKSNSHLEIDDNWESCYGEHEFNSAKFPDPAGMVKSLRSLGFRTTLWIHPFVNIECPIFTEALKNNFLVKGSKGQTGLTNWWRGNNSGVVDFTNPKAVEWWTGRLRKLQVATGIDSFKFDAGETTYLPVSSAFPTGPPESFPSVYSKAYAEVAAKFGGMVEVRTGKGTQNLPIFTRILDRWSLWGYDNGIRSVLPTVFQFSTVGYLFVLPDMVGGNKFEGQGPSKELYIRWIQLNAFLPAFQFSLAPWDFKDAEVVQIARSILSLRESLSDLMLNAAQESVQDGSPIIRPLWWADPDDNETLTIDSEFLIGETLLVAPVLEQGAVTRDIYLPKGNWTAYNGREFEGAQWIRNFPAPLNTLPFFLRSKLEFYELTNEISQD